MRRRPLVTLLLTASLVGAVAAPAASAWSVPGEARVRVTGELVRTSVERPGARQWTAIKVGGRHLPVEPAALTPATTGSTVTVDVSVPQTVVDAASADRTLRVPAAGTGATPSTHALTRADLSAAADASPAPFASGIGSATADTAAAPGSDPLHVSAVVSTRAASAPTTAPTTRRITYVPVTPKGVPGTTVSATTARQQVASADAYWRDQSAGELRIGAPTIKPAYLSAYSCRDNPIKRFDEAAERTGFTGAAGSSLVLVLPRSAGAACGYGLGTLGESRTSPGVLHVADTAAPVLAHELGHNIGLDHANALVCTDRSDARLDLAAEGWTGCDEVPYGDSLDIMGPSSEDDLPMLSAPQALRHGLLPASASTRAGSGTTRVTLAPLSGLAGARAAVTTDLSTGVSYWVEYRTPTGRDATNPSGQDTGVRVLRTTPWAGSVVLDPTPTGALDGHVSLTPRSALTSTGGRITITTESASAEQAVVTIVNTSRAGTFTRTASPRISGTAAVGRTLSATTGTWSPSPSSHTYRWRRDGTSIAGATGRTYVPTVADAGRRLTVAVTARRTGYTSQTATSGSVGVRLHATTRPYLKGSFAPGRTLTVMVGVWTPSASSYTYQWYRDGVALKGATRKTYTLTQRDRGTRVHVRMTARRTGFVSGAETTLRHRVAR